MALIDSRKFVADIAESYINNRIQFGNYLFQPVNGSINDLEKEIRHIQYKKRFFDSEGNELSGDAYRKAESLEYVLKRYNKELLEEFEKCISDEFEKNIETIYKQIEERLYPDIDSKTEEDIDFLLREIDSKFEIIDEACFKTEDIVEKNVNKMINYYVTEGGFQYDEGVHRRLKEDLTLKVTEKVNEYKKQAIYMAERNKEQFLTDSGDSLLEYKRSQEENKLETKEKEEIDKDAREDVEEKNKEIDENVDKENTQIVTVDVNDAYLAASAYGILISYDNEANKFRAFDSEGHELNINTNENGKLYVGTPEEYIAVYYSDNNKSVLEVESNDSKRVSINKINHAVQVKLGEIAYSIIGNEITKFTNDGADESSLEEVKLAMEEAGLKFESIPELVTLYEAQKDAQGSSRN